MNHPMITSGLVAQQQAEMRRIAAAEHQYQTARRDLRQQRAAQRPPRLRLLRLVRLRWHARRHRLAQRRYPADWQREVRAIAARRASAG
jgi:hypothetical protein